MATYLSPGVYARELDYSAYAARVASSIIALVGTAPKGPVNEPTLLTSPSNAQNIFGTPMPTLGTKARFGLHAVMNALNQTGQVWYTRVTDGTEATAKATAPIIVNSQVVYLALDNAGITIAGGKIAIALRLQKRPTTELNADAFNALVRRFGASNVFDSLSAIIENQDELEAALAGSGAFVQIIVPMASTTKTFENYDQFVSRFNRLMVDAPLRAESLLVQDNVNGVQKFILIKTQNLSDLLALNLEFKIIDDTLSVSPAGSGYALAPYDGGTPYSQLGLVAKKPGIGGNGISVIFNDVGNTFTGLPAVTASGMTITVNINEGVTIAADVVTALNASGASRLVLTASNGAGSDGSGLIDAGTASLSLGGSNLPQASIVNPTGTPGIGTINLSTSWTQRLDGTTTKILRFNAVSPGSYANVGNMIADHDDTGLESLEYRENNNVGEKAVNLRVQPVGVAGSFLDALSGFQNVAAPVAADYTLLLDTASLTLALGTIDVITDIAAKSWLTWNAYEFYDVLNAPFAGGLDGIPDNYDDLVETVIGNPADGTGLYAYANREVYDNSLIAAPGFDQSAVIRALLSISETAGDMIAVVDPPMGTVDSEGLTPQEVVDWHNGKGFGNSAAFNSSFGGLYYGWEQAQDIFNGTDHWIPPSVLVLEQIAYSDNVSEVWFAPAGFKRGRLVKALATQSNAVNNQGDRDFMYSNGNAVNPIVNFPKDGVVIFGQRTLQRNASALDRINVRRMLNYVKRASVGAVRPELFDPNDAILWKRLTDLLNPIFNDVKNKRGLNKFEVKIDATTTPALARDNNEVYGYIILEPTKAAEKIILTFVLTAQGASFSEALAAAGVV